MASAVAKRRTRAPSASRAVAIHQPRSLIEVLVEASRDPNVNPQKMREMVTMVREPEYNAALLSCQQAMPRVIKSAWNPHTKSHWARLETLSETIDPIIHQHGFTLSFSMAEGAPADHYRIVCDVSHTCGLSKRYWADIGYDSAGPKGTGNKTLAQGSGSSISYGRRYLKMMIFDIVPVGEDQDGAAQGSTITHEQGEDLLAKISASGLNMDKFRAAYDITDVRELPSAKLKDALRRVEDYRKKGFQKADQHD